MSEKKNVNTGTPEDYTQKVLQGIQGILEAIDQARQHRLRSQAEMIGTVVFSSDAHTDKEAFRQASGAFAATLSSLQRDSGMSQREIAKQMDTHQSWVSEALSGKGAGILTYMKIVNILGGTLQVVYTPPEDLEYNSNGLPEAGTDDERQP